MSTNTQQPVAMYTGATVNGVQTEAEVLMARHTPHDWPTLVQGLDRWEVMNAQLKPVDFPINLKDIVVNGQTGGLFNQNKSKGDGAIIPTRTALAHLVSYVDDRAPETVANMLRMSPATRAMYWQDLKASAPSKVVHARSAVRATLNKVDDRVIRAFVTDLHSKDTGDDAKLVQALRKLSGKVSDARIRVVKEWDNTHVEVLIPNKFVEVKKGRKVYARLNFSNSETKGGSQVSSVGTLDLWCLNGAVAAGNGTTITLRHTGDIQYKMAAAAETVINLLDDALHEHAQAYAQEFTKPRSEVIERFVKQYKLPETTGVALAALWDADGVELGAGNTVAGLANAVTRHAQALPIERAVTMETIAGKVMAAGLSAFL